MNVNVHIERLILDATCGGASEAARIEKALRAELTRLWSAPGAPEPVGRAEPFVLAAPPAVRAAQGPVQIGQTIAHSVYGAVAK